MKKTFLLIAFIFVASCSKDDLTNDCNNKGSLKVQSLQDDPYTLRVDGANRGTISPFGSITISNLASGTHSVQATQNSGYILYPTVYEDNFVITDCETTALNLN